MRALIYSNFMQVINIKKAGAYFQELLTHVKKGETIIIEENGVSIAQLVAFSQPNDKVIEKKVKKQSYEELIESVHKMREKNNLGDITIQELMQEARAGRR